MRIISSRRRYFDKPDGTRRFVGRRAKYEYNNEVKEIFIKEADLVENIEYQELKDYLVIVEEGE